LKACWKNSIHTQHYSRIGGREFQLYDYRRVWRYRSTHTQKWDYAIIAEPYQGFPAQKNDIRAGDTILDINGGSMKGKEISFISEQLKELLEQQLK